MYPFYLALTPKEKQEFDSSLKTKKYEKGSMIHCHGETCIGMFRIKKGSVSLSVVSDEGKKVTFFRMGEGEICVLGAACILRPITFDVHLEAADNCVLEILNAQVMSSLMNTNPKVESYIYKMATEKLSGMVAAVQELLFYSIEKRIARFLWQESFRLASDTIVITHEEIAHYTGSAREVVTRELNKMAKNKVIALGRKSVEIIDKNALEQIM